MNEPRKRPAAKRAKPRAEAVPTPDDADEVEDGGEGGPGPEATDARFDDRAGETVGAGRGGRHSDPRVQAGLDHLQRAAHEVIAASRALLDVAEELVDDPKAAGHLVDLLGSFAAMARPLAGRPGNRHAHDPGEGADEPDDPPVQRIPIS